MWRACVPNPPFPNVKLHVFWKSERLGPYEFAAVCPELSSKTNKNTDDARAAFAQRRGTKAAASAVSAMSEAALTIEKARNEARGAKRQEVMQRAREAGAADLKRKRAAAESKFAWGASCSERGRSPLVAPVVWTSNALLAIALQVIHCDGFGVGERLCVGRPATAQASPACVG